jgi:hypothetical protein
MKTRALTAALWALLAVSLAGSAAAQVKNGIEHTPGVCLRAGELPLLQVTTSDEGELRGYFRRINTTDWCSVEGTNEGPLSRVVLPKFEAGDEIEYFFVLLDGARVVGRSSRIYRARITADCDVAFARHMIRLSMSCGEDAQAIPAALGAGFLIGEITKGDPPYASPDRPNGQ